MGIVVFGASASPPHASFAPHVEARAREIALPQQHEQIPIHLAHAARRDARAQAVLAVLLSVAVLLPVAGLCPTASPPKGFARALSAACNVFTHAACVCRSACSYTH